MTSLGTYPGSIECVRKYKMTPITLINLLKIYQQKLKVIPHQKSKIHQFEIKSIKEGQRIVSPTRKTI